MTIFYSSDDNVFEAIIYDGNSVRNIDAGATVTAFVQDVRGSKKIMGDITILSGDTGNDWSNGLIRGVFNDTESVSLAPYDFKEIMLCVRITEGTTTNTYTENIMARKLV